MSKLNVSNITDGTTTVGTSYVVNGSAKAWVGVLSQTATIGDSLNVSSAVDDGSGFEQVLFTASFDNNNYVTLGSLDRTTSSAVARIIGFYEKAVGSVHVSCSTVTGGVSDQDKGVSFAGDLA